MNIQQDFIRPNIYTRPRKKLKRVSGIVYHWTACPNASAINIRNYFDKLNDRFASAHYVIGLEGEIIQMIPDEEMAYHVGAKAYNPSILKKLKTTYPNNILLGIEMCHPDWSGKFTEETYQAAIELGTYLIQKYNIPDTNIFRHYDITYKNCPRYFVDHPNKWKEFLADLFSKAYTKEVS